MDRIESRLQDLERKLEFAQRRSRVAFIACASLVALLGFGLARSRLAFIACASLDAHLGFGLASVDKSAPDEVRALRFILEDDKGLELAVLGIRTGSPSRESGLFLKDEKGTERLSLSVSKDLGSGFYAMDESGTIRVQLAYAGLLGARLNFRDRKGNTHAAIDAFPEGQTFFTMKDDNNKDRVEFSLSKQSPPCLVLRDEAGKDRAILGGRQLKFTDGRVVTYPESSLLLFDPEGKLIAH